MRDRAKIGNGDVEVLGLEVSGEADEAADEVGSVHAEVGGMGAGSARSDDVGCTLRVVVLHIRDAHTPRAR